MRKIFFIVFLIVFFWFLRPYAVSGANLQDASATLGNSRLSYKQNLIKALNKGTRVISVASTENLFTNDRICFVGINEDACKKTRIYTVAKILDKQTFSITQPLQTSLSVNDRVLSPQVSSAAISFTTIRAIPEGGRIRILFPDALDISTITEKDIRVQGCRADIWKSSFEKNLILINRLSGSCEASSRITITIDNSPGIVNPTTGATYTVQVKTQDGTESTIDRIDMVVRPTSGVSVRATVGGYQFNLFGYASPFALVTLDGARVFDQTTADKKGYFIFENRSAPFSLKEACVSARDQVGRISNPVCIPVPPTKYITTIGPVILPPTLSFNRSSYFIGDEVVLSGQTLPDTNVNLSVFIDRKKSLLNLITLIRPVFALAFSDFQARSDQNGNFSVILPSSSSDILRLFAQTNFDNEISPKSTTLQVNILPLWLRLLLTFHILEFLIVLQLIGLSIYLLRRYLHPHVITSNRAIVLRPKYELELEDHDLNAFKSELQT